MLKVYNELNVQVACLGNHDLDFGVAKMVSLTSRTAPCEWLMSNFNVDGKPIGGLAPYTIKSVPLTYSAASEEKKAIKIGFFGLAGPDWHATMSYEVTETVEYVDFVETGREMAAMLKAAPHNCELVVALTHMRVPEDRTLAEKVPDIDISLGGHDHLYLTEVCP